MKDTMTISLRELFTIIKRKLWIIALVGIIFGLVTAGINQFLLKPVYEANTTIITNKEVDEEKVQMSTSDDLIFSQRMAITYSKIITSDTVLNQVIDNLNLDMKANKLAKYIDVENIKDTQIIKISVRNGNPKTAAKICNEIPTVFEKEVKRITKASGVEVIDKATVPTKHIRPRKTVNIIIATLIGIILAITVILLREILDKTIKTTKDIEKYFDFNILGVVSKQKEKLMYVKDLDRKNLTQEEFIKIRTNIQYANIDNEMKVILFTSTHKDEGKSILSLNTAYKFSELEDMKVLLIDCDLRNPTINKILNKPNQKGVMDILLGKKDIKNSIEKVNDKFDILFTGKIPQNPTEILASKKMKNLIDSLKDDYDYIFIDTPPIGVVSDCSILSRYSDGLIYIMASKESEIDYIKESIKGLQGIKIIGCILNKFDAKEVSYYNYSYYSSYYGE